MLVIQLVPHIKISSQLQVRHYITYKYTKTNISFCKFCNLSTYQKAKQNHKTYAQIALLLQSLNWNALNRTLGYTNGTSSQLTPWHWILSDIHWLRIIEELLVKILFIYVIAICYECYLQISANSTHHFSYAWFTITLIPLSKSPSV